MNETCTECGIALGSNCGDRLANLQSAVAALRRRDPDVEVSPIYETAPVDCPEGSGAFLNAVAIVRWAGPVDALLAYLRETERSLGRPPERERNAPRSIDLDMLYAGATVRHDEALTIPHPRLHLRRFVLQPLADLRPQLRLPGFDATVAELLADLPVGDQSAKLTPAAW